MDFDLFVIGGGSGGVRAARIAAKLGARVAICEERRVGGTCVNVGCVPKKLMAIGARYPAAAEDAAGFGWDFSEPTLNWSRFIANKDREINRLNAVYRRILEAPGCQVFDGRGVRLITTPSPSATRPIPPPTSCWPPAVGPGFPMFPGPTSASPPIRSSHYQSDQSASSSSAVATSASNSPASSQATAAK